MLISIQFIGTRRRRAVSNEPVSEPIDVTARTQPKLSSPPHRSSASFGSDTL